MPDRFDDKPLRCSFCGREKPKQIRELIAGPGVHICADCVNLCNQILEGKQQRSREAEAVPDASEERLEKLIDMSRSLGDPEYDYIILGEGNTSAGADDGRESGSFYVKASGTSLRGIDEDGFVRVSREKARELLSADSLTDEQVAEGLIAASIDADGVRPSVETFLHALLLDLSGIEFIGHTHPTPVNALLCSQEPQEAIKGRLFPDEVVCCGPESAWVPYTDPG
ncbi:MAG: ClpX C4-type zinc finger protein, partial [Armatimonadota bacterium]